MNRMIPELKTLAAIARYGTFAAAADRIGLTQSAVSGHMRRLERKLGFPLFVRTGRSAELNEAGQRILGRAHDILAMVDALGAPTDDAEPGGILRAGSIASAQPTIALRALVPFHEARPGYRVQLAPGTSLELLDRVDTGELDLAIIIHPDFGLPRHLKWTPLVREPFVLAMPPQMQGDDWRAIAAGNPFLRYNRVSFGGRLVDRLLERSGTAVRDWVEVDDIPTLLRMVVEGMGVAIVPDAEAYRNEMGQVRCLPLAGQEIVREIGIVSQRAGQDRAAALFIENCVEAGGHPAGRKGSSPPG
ncbi:LysR family transcriptional regulator [Nitratireductor pacificus]|nr:LysR family transcriptional regulator [Nitratireductor pacificus]